MLHSSGCASSLAGIRPLFSRKTTYASFLCPEAATHKATMKPFFAPPVLLILTYFPPFSLFFFSCVVIKSYIVNILFYCFQSDRVCKTLNLFATVQVYIWYAFWNLYLPYSFFFVAFKFFVYFLLFFYNITFNLKKITMTVLNYNYNVK
jgi:hypothetical protein